MNTELLSNHLNRSQLLLLFKLRQDANNESIWEGYRKDLCKQLNWKNISTVSINLRKLIEGGFVKRLHTTETIVRHEGLKIQIVAS